MDPWGDNRPTIHVVWEDVREAVYETVGLTLIEKDAERIAEKLNERIAWHEREAELDSPV